MNIKIILLAFSLVGLSAFAQTKEERFFNRVVDTIWYVEGGNKTKFPYGIVSIKTNGDITKSKRICYNTVKNNYFRWIAAGREGDYFEFLAKKYAPIGAKNDPKGLNRNWLKNFRFYYDKLKREGN